MSEQEEPADVLFLDDMEERHRAFLNKFGMRDDIRIWQARTAREAIDLLKGRKFLQAFLDHDLSLDDIMCQPGGPSKVPTGMEVVKFLESCSWDDLPVKNVIIHSMNEPAASQMVSRLQTSLITARWVPFHLLMA